MIGAGGTGKTQQLQAVVDELVEDERASAATWLTGTPLRAVDGAQVAQAIEQAAADGAVVVADELQWFSADALDALADALSAQTALIVASHRPPVGDRAVQDRLDLLDDLLTAAGPPARTGLLDLDAFAPVLAAIRRQVGSGGGGAMSTELLEGIHALSGGSPGLAADIVALEWDLDPARVPAEVTDAVTRRVRRAGDGGADLIALWSVAALVDTGHDPLTTALGALADDTDHDPGRSEREVRAGGLVTDDGALIPIVARAVVADLVRADRAALHDRLARHLAEADPVGAARHILAGRGQIDGAERILASAALTLARTDPDDAHTMLDRAADLGLPEADRALLRGLIAFHAGSPEALGHLNRLQQATGGELDERAALLGFGLDLRELRFDAAGGRPLGGELAPALGRLARSLVGDLDTGHSDASHSDTGHSDTGRSEAAGATPLGQMVAALAGAVSDLARGDTSESLGTLATAADDFDRLRPTAPLGLTPHGLGAMTAIVVGDLTAADLLCQQGRERTSGGPGEQLTLELLQAYGQLVDGEYASALALLRQHTGSPGDATEEGDGGTAQEDDGFEGTRTGLGATDDGGGDDSGLGASGAPTPDLLSQRERLLLAAIEAAIARRSGDTGRLRAAWARAEQALIRQSTSWLLIDFFTDLLACGARLGDERRVGPVVDSLVEQTGRLPANGPGPVAGHWLRLQVALAADDAELVAAEASALAALDPVDTRSRARVAAAGVWAAVVGSGASEDEVTGVAEQLSAAGDGWEASRLLGQAALDEEDPKAARRLLELARLATSDQVDDDSGDGLAALGLSEREADVAVLVAEGRTHKEVGAQLFISPKTVEHHVAKIRQKLGATSRAELLSLIREAVE